MENHHSGLKSRTNSIHTTPSGDVVSFYSIKSDPYGATESGMQQTINASSQSSMEISNSSYNGEMDQSRSVSTCSSVIHPNTGSFVESVDSSGTIVTSSSVPVESRAVSKYQQHHHSQAQPSTLLKNEESLKRTQPSPCWALIEWETSNGEPSSYTVINSSQIVEISRENSRSDEENGQQMRDSALYTGKLIHVLRGRYIMPATIVIISEDRQFLETELHELRMMAANNLIAKSIPQTQPYRKLGMPTLKQYGRASQAVTMQSQQNTIPTSPENITSTKRQRCDSGSSSSVKEIEARVSSACVQGAVQEETRHSFNGDISYQKVLPPLKPAAARFNRSDSATKPAPPMTFDQQTQTTGASSDVTASYDAKFVRILSYLESVMAEQKGYRMESEYNRKLLHELQEKISEQHEMLRNVQKRVAETKHTTPSKANPESQATQSSSGDILIEEVVEQYSSEPGVGSNTMVIDSYETSNGDHLVMNSVIDSDQQWKTHDDTIAEEQQTSNSNHSWTSSNNNRTQTLDYPTRSSTISQPMDKSSEVTSKTSMLEVKKHDETVVLSTNQTHSNSAKMVHELINNDWDDSMQENERNNNQKQGKNVTTMSSTRMVAIGSNNTMVCSTVLENIKWVSYKYATRKLLQAVIPRNVLATHSLSGRPCPSHLSFTDKPVKGRLDPNIVADVIEFIRQKFTIDESHVRAVITNKCADENKMLRMKNSTTKQASVKKTALASTRKTRNKENVSSTD
ncbi:uncharacterized protein LOC128303769 [Anopheles moucheti]|uniref:uncharacterized protein LOC128303769 n=1 Tax=Anopheles moucheti TaxID=186751 RepID=UPI0022EFD8C5|nr:uncharacterized protein LOC128303769 [Anopheles moucheti]